MVDKIVVSPFSGNPQRFNVLRKTLVKCLAKRFLSRSRQAGGKIIQPNCAGTIVKVARSGILFISRDVEERQTPKSRARNYCEITAR